MKPASYLPNLTMGLMMGLAGLAGVAAMVGACATAEAAEPRAGPATSWSDLLTRDEVGASAWTRAHPTWDGRGVVIAVLDTGVDPSVPGLDALPAATTPKVIATRDFSGQGHVALARARTVTDAGVAVVRLDADGDRPALVARGHAAHVAKVGDDKATTLWLGVFDEATLAGSDVSDIDRDGRGDGRFVVLVIDSAQTTIAIVDTDGDGDLADEEARRSYADDPRWFVLGRPADPLANRAPVAMTLHIDMDSRRVELHFDDGGHGTHCAGIAAGYRIDGKDGFDGIAPGAQVMSLKIGHNGLSGGATTRGSMASALRYASQWARERQVPVVVNLSYGVGSEREGHSDIDKLLDELLLANPWLAVNVSGGNEGPGLSSVGTPGAATLAWTSAALLTEGQARTLFGGNSKGRKVFAFSSRGGELDKPDGLAPGTAWSTVPPFSRSSVMSGTSMAAPQAAGVHALIASAALQSALPWTNGLAHRALETGAKPIAGFSPLDQGAGLIDVGRAWEAYRREAKAPGAAAIAGWRVSTPVAHAPGRTGSASYWRVGRFLPAPTESIVFKVQPLVYTSLDADTRARHMDTLTLASDVGWLTPDRQTLALRGEASADVVVRMDAGALEGRPGLHVGRIRASTRGVHAFDLPVVVVMPAALEPGSWSQAFTTKLAPGDVGRVFVQVPPGATSMAATLAVRGRAGQAWLLPFDPEGRHVEIWEHMASGEDESVATFVATSSATSGATAGATSSTKGPTLAPGTWELAIYAPHKNRGTVELTLDVVFRALDVPDALYYRVADGGRVEADLTLTNRLDQPFRGTLSAQLTGIVRPKTIDASTPVATAPIVIGDEHTSADLELEVDDATWARMTDIAVNVKDGAGAVVAQTAFGQRKTHLHVPGAGRYTLEITAGLTDPDDTRAWSVVLTERHRRAAPDVFEVTLPGGMARPTLLPDVRVEIDLGLPRGLTEAPAGFSHEAEIVLTGRGGETWARLVLPLRRR